MSDQLIALNAPTIAGDSLNIPSAYVKRDSNGNINVGGVLAALFSAFGAGLSLFGKSYSTTQTGDTSATVVGLNATGGAFTYTLPLASASTNQILIIYRMNTGSNLPTVKGNGSDNINGANTYTGLTAQFKMLILWCDGTQWIGGLLS